MKELVPTDDRGREGFFLLVFLYFLAFYMQVTRERGCLYVCIYFFPSLFCSFLGGRGKERKAAAAKASEQKGEDARES